MRFGLVLLLVACATAFGANTWYVDCNATGPMYGTNWATAFTNITDVAEDKGIVVAGDTVEISGGTYTNAAGIYLEHGSDGVWTTYKSSQADGHNSEVLVQYSLSLKAYTELYGAKAEGYAANIGDDTYSVPLVTNNCNFFIDKSNDFETNQRAIIVWSGPVKVQWVHVRGAGQSVDPGGMVIYYAGDTTLTATNPMEIAYCWSDLSTGHGHLGLGGVMPGQWGGNNVHHSLFENHWADFGQWGSGIDLHHCVIRHRADKTFRGGCNDTFQVGAIDLGYFRIYNNIIEPLDNTIMYLGGCTFSNMCIYNNVYVPVPEAYLPTNQVAHQGKDNVQAANRADYGEGTNDIHWVSGVYYLNNTVDMREHGAESLMVYYNRDMFDNGGGGTSQQMVSVDNGMWVKNNLLLHFSVDGSLASPLNLYGNAVPAEDTYVGWVYTTNNMVIDYNVFWSTYRNACLGWSSGTNRTMLTNAAEIALVTGCSNNVSDMAVTLTDETSYNYMPTNGALTIGTNLTSLTNMMPSINTDIYGRSRPATGAWTVGAVEYYSSLTNGLLLHLTFAQDDGWTTNRVVTDRSGMTNSAVALVSTNRETLPTWTAGPTAGISNAAQFVINWTNNGAYYGTYLCVTNLYGLKFATNGSWSLWASLNQEPIDRGYGAGFLSVGIESNNWTFGRYSAYSPAFYRSTGWGGMFPSESYASWPHIMTTAWHHYAVTWDATNWIAYLDGTVYTGSAAYATNGASSGDSPWTNQYSGMLFNTNSVGGVYNWMGVGVLTHSGTPNPDDADDFPNNGQLWGRLSDVRIYNRVLTASEIADLAADVGGLPESTTNRMIGATIRGAVFR